MKTMQEIVERINCEQKISFEDFLTALESYGELEFYFRHIKYGTLRLNDDYSFGKDKKWNRSKDYYVLFEINNINQGWKYKTLKDFESQASIKGVMLKTAWNEVNNISTLDATHYHGFDTVHEHDWFGEIRGPARELK